MLWISGSNTVSGVSDGLINWTITNRFLGISMVFWYGVAADDLPLVRVRLHGAGPAAAVRRSRAQRVAAERHQRRPRALGRARDSAFVAAIAGIFYAGLARRRRPDLGAVVPAAGLRRGVPGRDRDQPGRFNPIGTFVAVFFLVSGITGLQLLGRRQLRAAALLRRRADPRRRPVAARAAQGHQGRGRGAHRPDRAATGRRRITMSLKLGVDVGGHVHGRAARVGGDGAADDREGAVHAGGPVARASSPACGRRARRTAWRWTPCR